ncbi:MAG: serine carboxypeptidase [Oscillochloridaceae bacterium umkhey_bin13]
MKTILLIHLGGGNETATVTVRQQPVTVHRVGCGGDLARARELITSYDGSVDAMALEDIPARLRLGGVSRSYVPGQRLLTAAHQTPIVDGSGARAVLERWAITLADRAQPGIFAQRRILMLPGLNHEGLAQALGRKAAGMRYADPLLFLGVPALPGVGSRATLDGAAGPTLDRLREFGVTQLAHPAPPAGSSDLSKQIRWADVIAGDLTTLRRWAATGLKRKTIVVESASSEDLAELRHYGASTVVALLDNLVEGTVPWRWSAAAVEAMLVTLRPDPATPLNEDTYLDLLAEWQWTPRILELQPDEAGINRFAFVIHPLDVRFIHKHPLFKPTRYLPDPLVEAVAAYMPPMYIGAIKGGVSPTTGQRIEGHLISLGATPRQMMRHGERFTYRQLNIAARMAERKGARLMGLGAFTSVVGDAGITVAHEADIAITSGNSLTVAATLEAAKQAVLKMGATDLAHGRAMVVGATGSIGAVCARLLAQAIGDVALVSIEPEKLIALKRLIETETPGARVSIATHTEELVESCDLIVTATSAFGQRIIDITRCKPGAVICDVARPPDISAAEAKLRPDVLVIESGEVIIPGVTDMGYDIGLPKGTAYACLGETALLAMDGRFEDYTLGRNISMERVKEIYRMFKKHEFQLAGLRSFGIYITDEDVAARRALAAKLLADPALLNRTRAEAREKLARLPRMAKGVREPAWTGMIRRGRDMIARAIVLIGGHRAPTSQPELHEEVR